MMMMLLMIMMMVMTWEAARADGGGAYAAAENHPRALASPAAAWFAAQGANLNRMRDFDPRFPSQR